MGEVQVGIKCASPEGDGYDVIFEDYRLVQVGGSKATILNSKSFDI